MSSDDSSNRNNGEKTSSPVEPGETPEENGVTTSDPTEKNTVYEYRDDTSRLKRGVRDFTDRWMRRGINAKRVTPKLFDNIEDAVSEGGGRLIQVEPYPENDSMSAAEDLFDELYHNRNKWFKLVNTSETHGFEIWFNDGKISFYFYVRSERAEKKFKKQIDAFYPNAQISPIHGNPRKHLRKNNNANDTGTDERSEHGRSWWDDRFLPIYDGDYVATARLEPDQHYLYPIRTTGGLKPLQEDPYKAITSEIGGDDLDRTMIQVLFRPANRNWDNGGTLGSVIPWRASTNDVVEALNSEKYKNEITTAKRPPSNEERSLAEQVSSLSSEKAYEVNIRITSFSPYKEEAEENVWGVASSFESEYAAPIGDGKTQSLTMVPGNGKKANTMLVRSAKRKWVDHDTLFTVPELAGLAHIPDDSIETPAITWSQTGKGARPPAAMPRFDEPEERLPPGVKKPDPDPEDNPEPEPEPEPESEDPESSVDSESVEKNAPDTTTNTSTDTDTDTSTQSVESKSENASIDHSLDTPDSADHDETNTTDTTTPDTNQDGIIGASFPDDTPDDSAQETSSAFPSHTTETTSTETEPESETANNVTGDENKKAHTNGADDSPTPDSAEDTSSTTTRDDPDTDTSNSTDVSSGYHKNVSFGTNNDNDDENEEDN